MDEYLSMDDEMDSAMDSIEYEVSLFININKVFMIYGVLLTLESTKRMTKMRKS